MGLTPQYRLTANDGAVTAGILDRFMSLHLTDEAGVQSDTLEVVLADHDPLAPLAIPKAGAELELWLGYDGAVQRMGLFVADEVELSGWPGTMTIRARAAAYAETPKGKKDLQTQKTRSWPKGTKLKAMADKIAKEHGMQATVAKSLANIVLPHFAQTDESDISFLVRVAKRYDAFAKPAGGKLVLAKRGDSKTASGDTLPSITVNATDCTSWRMNQAKREGTGSVVASWHNKHNARKIPITIGTGEPVKVLRHWYQTEDEAKSAAQSEYDKSQRARKSFSFTLPGNPTLIAESTIVAVGFRAGVDGTWLIKRAEHMVTSGGYVTTVECEQLNGAKDE